MEPSRGKSICVPFKSEDHYAICVVDPDRFRHYLMELHSRHPELLPAGFEHGFVFHDKTWSIKQRVLTRRLRLIATGQLYPVRPSFLMPSMSAWTEMVERGLYLRQWGVPFDALAYLFGRDAMFWYRAEVALGRPSLVGTLVKCLEKLPEHLLAEEKPTTPAEKFVYHGQAVQVDLCRQAFDVLRCIRISRQGYYLVGGTQALPVDHRGRRLPTGSEPSAYSREPRISVIPRVRGFDWRWLMRKNWYPRSLTMGDTLLYLTQ
jgi:hypothetical protein